MYILKNFFRIFIFVYLFSVYEASYINQYNNLIQSNDIKTIMESSYLKDNLVNINIDDDNYIICSSIINGKVYYTANDTKKMVYDSVKEMYKLLNPISMLDLLYMDVGDSLGQKIANSRVNENRKIIEDVIKKYIGQCLWGDKVENVKCKILKKDSDLNTTGKAIKNFITLLKEYSNFVPPSSSEQHRTLENKNTTDNILNSLLRKDFNDKTTLSNIIIYIHRMISSPWSQDSKDEPCVAFLGLQAYSVPRFSVITHTEQMIDWLSFKFGYNIQVIISGKAPCLKCSRYIRDATNKTVLDTWNNRTIIGFNTGWNNPKQLKEYQYPVKVFNATPVKTADNIGIWSRQFENPKDNKGTYSLSTPERELMWRNKNGYYGSNVYAIENYENYSKQLMMNSDGSVSEKEPKGEILRNPLERVNRTTYPILLPAAQNSTTGPTPQIGLNTQPNPMLGTTTQPTTRKADKIHNQQSEDSSSNRKKLKPNPPGE